MRDRTGRPVCAVVKADAYGHGQAAMAAMEAADCLAVATFNEAEQLRGCGKKVLILGPVENVPPPPNAVPSISTIDEVRRLRSNGWTGGVQIKVNTGMNRLGCRPETVRLLADSLTRAGMRLDGAFTHFHCPSETSVTAAQFGRFDDATRWLSVERHCCASNGLYLPGTYRLDRTRPGLALYGYGAQSLVPAMRVTSEILAVHFVRKGEYVGYGKFTVSRDGMIATVAGGYADGFRRMSGGRTVQVNGRSCKVFGQVCMDMFFIDVSDVPCRVGDEVVLLDGNGEQLAASYGTIVYEVLTGFGRARGRRLYVE